MMASKMLGIGCWVGKEPQGIGWMQPLGTRRDTKSETPWYFRKSQPCQHLKLVRGIWTLKLLAGVILSWYYKNKRIHNFFEACFFFRAPYLDKWKKLHPFIQSRRSCFLYSTSFTCIHPCQHQHLYSFTANSSTVPFPNSGHQDQYLSGKREATFHLPATAHRKARVSLLPWRFLVFRSLSWKHLNDLCFHSDSELLALCWVLQSVFNHIFQYLSSY